MATSDAPRLPELWTIAVITDDCPSMTGGMTVMSEDDIDQDYSCQGAWMRYYWFRLVQLLCYQDQTATEM
jgi:hypothetical protein